jgi:tellurite resistance protein
MLQAITEIQARLLSLLAWCDGDLHPAEIVRFDAILDTCPGSDSFLEDMRKLIHEKQDEEKCIQAMTNLEPSIAISIVKNAYAIAQEDGVFRPEERELILKVGLALGLDPLSEETYFKMLHASYESLRLQQELFK